jgi:two-component system CheB/CheR fusion protein
MRIVDTVREPLVVLDAKLRIESASKAFFDKFAVSAEERLSKSLSDLGDRQWDIPVLRKLLAEVLPESKKIEDYEVEPELPKLARRCYSMADASSGETAKTRCSFFRSNVTERKRAEETLRTHAEEISRLARGMVGRELRIIEEVNELCHRLGEVGRYPLEFEQDGKERPDSPRTRNQS